MMNGLHKRLLTLLATVLVASKAWPQMPFSLDASFQTSIFSSYVSSIGMMSDEGLLLSGRINFTPDPLQNNLGSARLMLDGSRDATFPTFPLTNGGGKITPWAGQYYVIAGQTVRRLLPNGYLDNTFAEMESDPYFSSLQAGDYHVFPDGRVLFAGTFLLDDTARDFVGPYRLAWFSNTGYLDSTRVHRQANGGIRRIRELADGRFLCYTTGNNYEGMSVNHLFRIHPDGAPDPTFTTTLGAIPTTSGNFRATYDIEPLSDGRILIGGFYGLSGTTDTLGVMRLLPDGELDVSFDPVPLSTVNGPSPWEFPGVFDILPLPDGRMIITGNFDHVRGEPRGGIAMLNADGTLSDDYFTGPGCGDYSGIEVNYRYIAGIVPAPNGEYYIHGAYVGYDDGTNNYPQQAFVSRLHGLNVGIGEREPIHVEVSPNPSAGQFTIQLDHYSGGEEVEVRDALGRAVLQQRITDASMVLDLSRQADGLYTIAVRIKAHVPVVQRVVIQR
jgi:uncharacterized delta-60 repeat protein